MIKTLLFPLLACVALAVSAAETAPAKPAAKAVTAKPAASKPAVAKPVLPDSKKMEQDMQNLPWPQFRTVIESVPKLRAEVEAYGALGWAYIQSKYKTHHWKKNIERLDDAERRQLAELIAKAKRVR